MGTFLVPRLVRAGHEVINISRGTSSAYAEAPEWRQVRQVVAETGSNRTGRAPSATRWPGRARTSSSTWSASHWNRPPPW
ncbi:hypothetical protein [Streptomyces sp. NPDC005859]|uniref:hypothetical protein n=1 Tax=Streptomyces sp. NPDC005859 TaxID=3157170 RepID=UPI003402AE54